MCGRYDLYGPRRHNEGRSVSRNDLVVQDRKSMTEIVDNARMDVLIQALLNEMHFLHLDARIPTP